MRIVVFGATGRTGRHVVRLATEGGHDVVAVTRAPMGYEAPAGVEVRIGNVLEPDSMRGLFASADAVISAIGPDDGRAPTAVYSDGAGSIVAEMRRASVGRVVMISAVPVSAAADKTWFERMVLHPILWRFFGASYRDLRLMEAGLTEVKDVAWAVVRPPRLTDKQAAGDVRRAWDVPLRGAQTISRQALAQVLVEVATAEPFRSGFLTVSQ